MILLEQRCGDEIAENREWPIVRGTVYGTIGKCPGISGIRENFASSPPGFREWNSRAVKSFLEFSKSGRGVNCICAGQGHAGPREAAVQSHIGECMGAEHRDEPVCGKSNGRLPPNIRFGGENPAAIPDCRGNPS
ncbi:MAG: hypothetical protein OXC72_06545 [Roseovarius sp.]|nr:hypothetical protein [Roseovarius sp.]